LNQFMCFFRSVSCGLHSLNLIDFIFVEPNCMLKKQGNDVKKSLPILKKPARIAAPAYITFYS